MKKKKIFKYILSKVIAFTMVKSTSFAVDNNILDKSIIKEFNELNELDDVVFSSIIETSDKNLVVIGQATNKDVANPSLDTFVMKCDSQGNQEWIKNFGGSSDDCFQSVVETNDGGIVAVGYSSSTNAGFTNKGGSDAIIVKYDSNGNQQWVKNFGGSNNDYFKSVIEMSDGGIVAVGSSYSTNAGFTNKGGSDAIIVKYDSNGNQQWVKNFGGSSHDYFNSVIETSDGGIIAVGNSNSTNAGFTNKGDYDAVVVKYDKDGNELWVKNFGGINSDYFYSVIETSDKGFVAVGEGWSEDTVFNNKGDGDAIVVKYDKDGNQLWVRNFGEGIENIFNSVIETKSGDIIAVGMTAKFSDNEIGAVVFSSLVKYDKDGNELGVRNFNKGFCDIFYSIKETVNGDFIIVGGSMDFDMESMEENVSPIFLYYNENYESIFEQINEVELNPSIENLNNIREAVNNIPEGIFKEYFQNRLNELNISEEFKRKTASTNLDLYIKCENILIMSLDTNSVTFEDFSGIEDIIEENAINISINSSLPYQLNAYLPTEIQNSDKSNTMDKRILNIKENSEADYKEFSNINEKVVLKDNCSAGNDKQHNVDLKLNSGIAHEKDVYKTTIKFEAEQK